MDRISAPQSGVENTQSHPRKIKMLPSRLMNSRSPRVVSKPKTPRLGAPPGLNFSQTPIDTTQSSMKTKNVAVGHVHAIQERSSIGLNPS